MCDTEHLNVWIEDFLRKRRFSQFELEMSDVASKGDGYLGQVTFVKVLAGREKQKVFNLVVKSAKKGEELRKQTPIKEVFDREMFMYTEVFPAMKQFQERAGILHPFSGFAKCYSVFEENDKEAIILENLKQKKFEVYNRMIPQTYEHIRMGFKNYGKFHAISYGIKQKEPELYKKLTENLTDLCGQFIKQANMLRSIEECFEEALKLIKNPEIIEKLRKIDIKNKIFKTEPTDKFSTILHGDCWNNNMMFQNSPPTEMIFLDFQLSCTGSPIYDLSYYLYAVGSEEIYKQFDKLLEIYQTTFNDTLKSLKVDYQTDLNTLKEHWTHYGDFGVIMCPFILKIALAEKDEVVDFAESAENGELADTFGKSIKNQLEFSQRAEAALKHFAGII